MYGRAAGRWVGRPFESEHDGKCSTNERIRAQVTYGLGHGVDAIPAVHSIRLSMVLTSVCYMPLPFPVEGFIPSKGVLRLYQPFDIQPAERRTPTPTRMGVRATQHTKEVPQRKSVCASGRGSEPGTGPGPIRHPEGSQSGIGPRQGRQLGHVSLQKGRFGLDAAAVRVERRRVMEVAVGSNWVDPCTGVGVSRMTRQPMSRHGTIGREPDSCPDESTVSRASATGSTLVRNVPLRKRSARHRKRCTARRQEAEGPADKFPSSSRRTA